jgi:hypothetical protein
VRVAPLGAWFATATLLAAAQIFALAADASKEAWAEAANEVAFALVGVALVARGSCTARVTAARALGLVVGLSKAPA